MVSPKKSTSKCNINSPTKSSTRVSSSNASSASGSNLKSTSKTQCCSRSSSRSRPGSRTSVKSTDSMVSVGIGVPPNAGTTVGKLTAMEYTLRFRLMPEGPGLSGYQQKSARLHDCVVFIITCKKHDTVALTAITTRRPYSWWPFVPLQDAFTWSRNTRDGLMTVLGNSTGGAAEGEEAEDGPSEPTLPVLPEHSTVWQEMMRVQLPKSSKCVHRLTQLITLSGTDECCKQATTASHNTGASVVNSTGNIPIRWVKRVEIVNQTKGALWGAEVLAACRRSFKPPPHYLGEFTLHSCISSDLKALISPLMQQLSWTTDHHVQTLYRNYLEHMYPALEMSGLAFRSFVRKNKLVDEAVDNDHIGQVFRAMVSVGGSVSTNHLTFGKLLAGLAVKDPKASTQSVARAQFIIRFYDSENLENGLNSADLSKLIADLEPNSSEAEHKSKAASLLKTLLPRKLLDAAALIELSQASSPLSGADHLLRWSRSYFAEPPKQQQEKPNSKSKSGSGVGKTSSQSGFSNGSNNSGGSGRKSSIKSLKSRGSKRKSKSSSAGKTLCSFHTSSFRYHYSCHAVTVDSSRRSGDARIICDDWVRQWKTTEMTRHRYSLENVFRENSVANIFYTLVRDKEGKLGGDATAGNRGLLSPDSDGDQDTLLHYIEVLCFQVRTILRHEPKLLRLAGPVHVIGDIRGSLADLFALEHCLFPAVPSVSQTLLFLGNYSDSSSACQSWGTECIFYLMALKLLMPNKIYLLRGRYELRPFNVAHLSKELAEKYGQAMGEKVTEMINQVFDHLPLAATIEESIICTHSGIPQLPTGKTLLDVLGSKEMEQLEALTDPVEKVAPAAYEIITNMPTNYANSPEFYLEGKQIFHPSFVKDSKENCSYFNGEAFGDFMRVNKFDMFVRSHNPCKAGYAMTFDRRCLTLFSSHFYHAGRLPWTSALQVDPLAGKLRILLLEHKSKGGSRNKKST